MPVAGISIIILRFNAYVFFQAERVVTEPEM
jgi:hypothetical protein